MNNYKIIRYLSFILPFSVCISTFLFIQCSGKPGKHPVKTRSKTIHSLQGIQVTGQADSIQNRELDSLKILLEAATHDTTRLRILDVLANAETNDSISTGYNEQIETLAQKNLAANPPAGIKNTCLKFLANNLHRKGNLYTNRYDFPKALEYFNESLKLREEIGDKSGISASLLSIGNTYYYQGDIQKAIDYYKKSLKLSEETGDKNNISRSLNNIGIMYADMDDIPKALEYYNKNLKVQEELGDKSSIIKTLNNIGITYSYQGDMPNALEYYSKCLKLSEELGDKKAISVALSNIGTIYEYQQDFPAALEYYYKSLKFQEELGDKSIIPGTLTNIGNVYIDQAEAMVPYDSAGSNSLTKKALEYYYKSLQLSEETGDKNTIAETLINIGQTYDEQAVVMIRYDRVGSDSLMKKALEYYNESLKFSEELGDKSSMSFALVRIGTIYLRRNETTKALSCTRRAYNIAKETGYTFNIRDAAALLDKIYTRQGNYKLSRQYFGEYITMRDSIIKEENQQLVQKKYFQYQYEKKAATDSIAHSKEMEIANLQIEKQKAESRRQKMVIGFVIIGLLLVLMFAGYIFRSLRITRKQKSVIEEQKVHIEHIHEEQTDSIRYAERIQNAVLPSTEYINEITAECRLSTDDYFILYKPRDIVSGDFYFFGKRNTILLIAVADCTGHGVPGAFMSMLGLSFLNQIITQEHIHTASQILDELRTSIIQSLQQKGITGEQKDGIDIVLISYDPETKTIQYSGAYNPLYLLSNNTKELTEIKPNRMPVAIYEDMEPFTNHVIQLQKGDILYLASDGYEDQFGGPKGKKFFSKYLKQLLTENCHKSMIEQKELLDENIENWKNAYGEKYEQTDDITIVGIKIT